MKTVKDYIMKLGFVFKQIFKAGPSVFFLSVSSMVIAGISSVLITYLTSELIERLGKNIESNSQDTYVKILGAFIAMFLIVIISYATESVKTVICAVAGLKLSHNIENIVADKFQNIKQERIDNPEFLDLHSNTLNRCGSEPLNLMESLFSTVANIISLLGYVVIIARYNFVAFLVILIFTLPILVFKRKYQGLTFRFYNERTMQLRRIMYYLELLTEPEYTNEVRGYRLHDYFSSERKKLFRDFIKGNTQIAGKEIVVSLFTSLLAMIGSILVGAWIILKTIAGTITVSEFYLLITAIMTLATNLLALSDQIASNSKSMMFINYIFDYMKEPNVIESKNLKIEEKSIHDICFENVSFKYTGTENYVLKNINVHFKTSETTEGRILLDGIDLKEYAIDEIRKFYGVLFQNYVKFSDNVRNCIGFGNIDEIQNVEGVAEAARLTGANVFIENYKNGYETNLSKMFFNDAIEPSGGQWQKIAISRAVYSDAQVLVLDEPTAALDPKSEVKMFDTFKKISELKSTLIISHRMYITKLADKIILLDKGQVIEEGGFEELIEKKEEFYKMYKIQADSYSI